MKIIRNTLLLLLFSIVAVAQQDPKAKTILDAASEKAKTYTTIEAKFEIIVTSRVDDTESASEGSIKIKGDKYYLSTLGTEVFCNGETMWSYLEDVNEVTIAEASSDDEDFIDNPAKIFNWYNRDFKYKYVSEVTLNGILMHEIDLFPNNLKQPYSRFKIFITKDNYDLYLITAIGKDGTDYSVFIKELKKNIPIDDKLFEFDVTKNKDIEVIDMRF